jgi:hypothetical protein
MTQQTEPVVAPLTEQQVRELALINRGFMSRVACGYLVEGPLDIIRLRHAVATVVARHTALRTAIFSNKSVDMQLVLPRVDAPLFELEGLPAALSVADVLSWVDERIGTDRIRLNQAPMWWVAVVRLSATSHVLLGVCSRLVMDFVSIAILFRSALTVYLLQHLLEQRSVPTQYLAYSLDQAQWRANHYDAWLDQWSQRVDFTSEVSTRGQFPASDRAAEPSSTDMFELTPAALVGARELAERRDCPLLHVLVAALALAERDVLSVCEHRFVTSDSGRSFADDRSIGAFQLNGLVAFQTSGEGAAGSLVAVVRDAWHFMEAQRGIGLEGLLEGLVRRNAGPVPIPFRISVQLGEPAPAPELPVDSKLIIRFLPNLAERRAPLDAYCEGSAVFVLGQERGAVMLSWWDAGAAGFFRDLWQSFPRALAALLARERLC